MEKRSGFYWGVFVLHVACKEPQHGQQLGPWNSGSRHGTLPPLWHIHSPLQITSQSNSNHSQANPYPFTVQSKSFTGKSVPLHSPIDITLLSKQSRPFLAKQCHITVQYKKFHRPIHILYSPVHIPTQFTHFSSQSNPTPLQSKLDASQSNPYGIPGGRTRHDFSLAWLEVVWHCSGSGHGTTRNEPVQKMLCKLCITLLP